MNVLCGNFKILGIKIDIDFATALNPLYLQTDILSQLEWRQFMTKDPELTV